MNWLRDHIFNYWHNWAAIWVMVLISVAVLLRLSDGTITALVGLAGAMFASTGAVHGWKATTQMKNPTTPTSGPVGFKADS